MKFYDSPTEIRLPTRPQRAKNRSGTRVSRIRTSFNNLVLRIEGQSGQAAEGNAPLVPQGGLQRTSIPKSLHKSACNRTSRSTEDIIPLLWGSPSALATLQNPPSPCPLLNLPPELPLNILSNLDPVSLVCLKITNRQVHNLVHVEKSSLNRCTNWLIRCRLEKDLIANGKPLPSRLTGVFCKRAHSRRSFGCFHKTALSSCACGRRIVLLSAASADATSLSE